MVARLNKARTCSDLVTAKVPRCVTALGVRGFLREALGAVLEDHMPLLESVGPERSGALIQRFASYDALQNWAKTKGGIQDDDEAFIDASITCALLDVRCLLFGSGGVDGLNE